MNLTLVITNNCNFACKTCLRGYGRGENLSLNLIKKIIEELKDKSLKAIFLTGGEPCLHPNFKEIIDLIARNKLKFTIVSNGSLLKEYKFILERYKKNLINIAFSLDGATKEVNDYIRAKNSFINVKKSIKYFVSHEVPVRVFTCINRLNYFQIEKIANLSFKLGVEKIKFMSLIETNKNKNLSLNKNERKIALKSIAKVSKKYKNKIILTTGLNSPGGVNFCPSLNNLESFSINPKGEFIFCCDTIENGAVIGSLKKESFNKLYNKYLKLASFLKKIRKRMINNGFVIEGFNSCQFCNYFLSHFIS